MDEARRRHAHLMLVHKIDTNLGNPAVSLLRRKVAQEMARIFSTVDLLLVPSLRDETLANGLGFRPGASAQATPYDGRAWGLRALSSVAANRSDGRPGERRTRGSRPRTARGRSSPRTSRSSRQPLISSVGTLKAARSGPGRTRRTFISGTLRAPRGGGWISRAQRQLDEGRHDGVERGYLLLPVALRSALEGDGGAAYATFSQAAAIGARFGDVDLVTMARHGQGRALIRSGDTSHGVALLDEVMVAVTAGEVSPGFAADVYCSVLDACREIYDLRRAQEWTAALGRWTASRTDVPTYRGQCLVHRAEILQVRGAWSEAMDEAERARESLSQPPPHPAVGAAFYQLAELHRLRGELAKAEEAYREASRHGREPQPGLAQLRLAQGRAEAAKAAIGRALDEAKDRWSRSRMLGACVEIRLATGDVPAARAAADELEGIAASLDAPYLHAMSAHAAGAVLLAEGDARSALATLRRASAAWRDVEAPYESARVRVLVGLACRALGDDDSASLEFDSARRDFQKLGAAPDVGRVKELSRPPASGATAALTAREVQVIVLLATGRTNRAIAEELAISERNLARHVSNIFTKVGVPSRAAATAYAFRHGLVAART